MEICIRSEMMRKKGTEILIEEFRDRKLCWKQLIEYSVIEDLK